MKIHHIPSLLALLAFPLITQGQVALRNQGDMHIGSGATVYIKGNLAARDSSDIVHPGKTVLTGHFQNHVTGTSTVFYNNNNSTARAGTFEFRGTAAQTVSATASKEKNYILFPNTVVINNNNDVTLDPTAAANMKGFTFTSGKLILDSKTATDTDESLIAHLWLEDGASTVANTNTKANIQVNLALGNRQGRLVGFTPPFKTMYADYFFFNFLSIPSETELFKGNSNELWNINPKRTLKAGEGYILGQQLVPFTQTAYYTPASQWSTAVLGDAFMDKFSFNRHPLSSKTIGTFVTEADRYTGEELVNSDVALPLINGYNYLGNPFTTPLSLAELITANRYNWGLRPEANVAQQYWVLSPGAKGNSNDIGKTFTFTATYLVGQTEGSTTLHGRNNIIAPMQMFVLKNNGAAISSFKIPKIERTHGTTQFLRSTYEPTDELLIETRDMTTGGFDRLCIVFRPDASTKATDTYDAEKLFNRTGGVNQIYTRSADNKELTTQVLPLTVNRLPLFFEPSLEAQEVELEASRLESLSSVYDVIIEDTKTGKKTSFFKAPVYRFTSSPGDSPNRFVLHFSGNTTGIEEIEQVSLQASYQNGIITLTGLPTRNVGTIHIYNSQGQLVVSEKATDTTMQINRPLPSGLYIINVQGQTVKLIIKN